MSSIATALIIGGNGFLGKYLSQQLIQHSFSVVIPTRSESPKYTNQQITWIPKTVLNSENLTRLIQSLPEGSVVINLVGLLHDRAAYPYGPGFKEAHVDLPNRIIQAMHQSQIKRLIHVSSIGADPYSNSMYQRSKGDGEQVIKDSSLEWTIFKPSVIFGRDDQFIQLFASLCRFLPILPLASSHSRFQPVAVEDVAKAIFLSINQANTVQTIIELGGPRVYTLKELVLFAAQTLHKAPLILPLPNWLGYLQALIFESLPGKTLMSRDNLRSMYTDNILSTTHQPLTELFGITPTPLETLLS